MKITAITFELVKEDVNQTMTVSHRLMSSEFAYFTHIPASEQGFNLPFPSNMLGTTNNQETPSVMEGNLRIVCERLGVKLNKCFAFSFDTEESVGIPASY